MAKDKSELQHYIALSIRMYTPKTKMLHAVEDKYSN